MEQDALKSAWQGIDTVPKSNTEVRSMMRENAHPVLKRVRKQMIMEIAAFAAFLFIYYDFFDGDRKPLYANVLLVIAMLFALVHNIIGYMLTKHRIQGHNIKQSLEGYLLRMRTYAVVSVLSRVLVAVCLLLFFTSVIAFDTYKYWVLVGVSLGFIAQIVLLSRIWMKRIGVIKEGVDGFYL